MINVANYQDNHRTLSYAKYFIGFYYGPKVSRDTLTYIGFSM